MKKEGHVCRICGYPEYRRYSTSGTFPIMVNVCDNCSVIFYDRDRFLVTLKEFLQKANIILAG